MYRNPFCSNTYNIFEWIVFCRQEKKYLKIRDRFKKESHVRMRCYKKNKINS